MCVCVCVRACVRACVRVCQSVRVSVHSCVRTCVRVSLHRKGLVSWHRRNKPVVCHRHSTFGIGQLPMQSSLCMESFNQFVMHAIDIKFFESVVMFGYKKKFSDIFWHRNYLLSDLLAWLVTVHIICAGTSCLIHLIHTAKACPRNLVFANRASCRR